MGRIVLAISDTEPVLDAKEASEFLGGVSRPTLHDYVRTGRNGRKLACRKIGGRIWFLPADLRAFAAPSVQETVQAEPEVKRKRRVGKERPEVIESLRRMGFDV